MVAVLALHTSVIDCTCCACEGKRGKRSTALGGSCLLLAFSSNPSGTFTRKSGSYRAAFPHGRPSLGGTPMPIPGEAGQMHRGDNIGPVKVAALVFAPCPNGSPAASTLTFCV